MIRRVLTWLAHEAWEKINVFETWRELKRLGQKHGTRFFIVAVLWELVEDVLFPYLSWRFGHPELIPVFLVLHFEPVVYPVFFFLFRTWDHIRGHEPWEPDRLAQSPFWRTALQVLSYRVPSFLMFYVFLQHLGVPLGILVGYVVGMGLFGFVHDRLWHDSNYGIDVSTDTVQPKRIMAKTLTYRIVSILVMSGVFVGLLGYVPEAMWSYQGTMLSFHLVHHGWWARNPLGIYPVPSKGS